MEVNQAIYAWSFRQKVLWVVVVGGIAIIVTSSRLQETLGVEPCVELERESDLELEPSLLTLTTPIDDYYTYQPLSAIWSFFVTFKPFGCLKLLIISI